MSANTSDEGPITAQDLKWLRETTGDSDPGPAYYDEMDRLFDKFERQSAELASLRARLSRLSRAANKMLEECDKFHDEDAHYIEVQRSAVAKFRAALIAERAKEGEPK